MPFARCRAPARGSGHAATGPADPAVRTVGARPDDPGRDLGAVRPPPPDRGAAGARGACGSGAGAGQGTLRAVHRAARPASRSEEHTSELQSLMRISYAVFCLKKKTKHSSTRKLYNVASEGTVESH